MTERTIAYFTMEIALASDLPTYSGGLGGLAGDTIQSAADLELPIVAITLLHRKGYFTQELDDAGNQTEKPVDWEPEAFLEEKPARTSVSIEGRTVQVRAWQYTVTGATGHEVPVYFLDTDLPENDEHDRGLSHQLYGGGDRYRLAQEVVLGIGGARILQELGHEAIDRYHMNEGHAALLTLALLNRERDGEEASSSPTREQVERVREQCVFTTHTPVPAGHDRFSMDLVADVLNGPEADYSADLVRRVLALDREERGESGTGGGTELNMTHLALSLSHYVNGVAKRHGEVSRLMFGDYPIDSITNGVHVGTWVSDPFRALYDRHVPGWTEDSFSLRYALGIDGDEIWAAHQSAKQQLLDRVKSQTGVAMDDAVFTIGFARRMTPYKRANLIFHNLDRLKAIADASGPLQLIFAGKAHPRDENGKDIIRRIFAAKRELEGTIDIAYLPNYDKAETARMVAGVDLWLNTPEPPNEASGTSGMKAALNGVPQLSTRDGWWLEGHIEGTTGWAFGSMPGEEASWEEDARSLYNQLAHVILPKFYNGRSGYTDIMRHAIALNGSFFNTQRMVQEYVIKAYL